MLKIVKTFFNTFVDWSRVLNKPATFAPSTHNQAISTITGLSDSLSGKSDTSHNHSLSNLTEKSYNSLTDKPTIPDISVKLDTSEYNSKVNQDIRSTASPSFAGLSAGSGLLKVDNTNSRVGIGTSTPAYPMHFCFPTSKVNATIFEGYGNDASALGFKAMVGRGTQSAPAALQQYDNVMAFTPSAHNGGSGTSSFSKCGGIVFMIDEAPIANATYYKGSINFKVSDGTNVEVNRMQINGGNGGIYQYGFGYITNNISTSTIVSVVKGIANQSGNLQEFRNSSNAVLTSVDKDGIIKAAGYKSSDGSTGATGSFTSADGKTVTVKNGLITNIA